MITHLKINEILFTAKLYIYFAIQSDFIFKISPKSQEVVFEELEGCVLSNEDAFHPLLKGRQRDLSSASSRRHQVIRHLESGGSIVSTPTDYGMTLLSPPTPSSTPFLPPPVTLEMRTCNTRSLAPPPNVPGLIVSIATLYLMSLPLFLATS
ncbi:hypothetical protein CDAR_292011 [Caerostris darwini]|uniref:Uncharacterized protein n=1 Tax=Caerostris darwini TaxID=1538125 RepID=A0AAV4UPC2_9ARAC|nr:hypothetical protein CDAR_292011 [Caerostris darwini]